MSCHKLIDHISALRRVGEERADELYQLMSLEVDESTFIKEVADICQGGLLGKKIRSIIFQFVNRNDLPRARKDTRI
jgi:hypothetical protein